jgi:hypothetical protein
MWILVFQEFLVLDANIISRGPIPQSRFDVLVVWIKCRLHVSLFVYLLYLHKKTVH